ncbi:MAG: hypothetical protein JF603_00815 [Acidobacteria bacterium]|nr:hypothetical protein [Acidobacteriota bacterium]
MGNRAGTRWPGRWCRHPRLGAAATLLVLLAVACNPSGATDRADIRAPAEAAVGLAGSALAPGRPRAPLSGALTADALLLTALRDATAELLGRAPTAAEGFTFIRVFHAAELEARRRHADGLTMRVPIPGTMARQFVIEQHRPEIQAFTARLRSQASVSTSTTPPPPTPVRAPNRPLPPAIPMSTTSTTTATTAPTENPSPSETAASETQP